MIKGITWTFRSFRGALFHKLVNGQELYFAVSYSKPALAKNKGLRLDSYVNLENRNILFKMSFLQMQLMEYLVDRIGRF